MSLPPPGQAWPSTDSQPENYLVVRRQTRGLAGEAPALASASVPGVTLGKSLQLRAPVSRSKGGP